MASTKPKRGARGRAYRILWEQRSEKVTASEWSYALASGLTVPAIIGGKRSDRVACLAEGVKATLENGVLWLRRARHQVRLFIYTSWLAIDRNAPMVRGEFWQKEVCRQYAPNAPDPDADIVDRWGQLEGPNGVPVMV